MHRSLNNPTSDVSPVLDIRNVSMRFGGLQANQDVSLAVHRGEIRGLIGPNGAGKTTLINILTGVYKPTNGDIYLSSQRITGKSPMEICRAGLVRSFQVSRTFRSLSVYENLMVPIAAREPLRASVSRTANDRANELLALTGLNVVQDLKAGELSGGQQVLLQAAMGFMIEKLSCYLLDEAFAGVNPVIIDKLIHLIEHERKERGIAFLVVSHEMSIIKRISDHVTVLAEGQVLAEGSLDELAKNEEVVQAYLGRGSNV